MRVLYVLVLLLVASGVANSTIRKFHASNLAEYVDPKANKVVGIPTAVDPNTAPAQAVFCPIFNSNPMTVNWTTTGMPNKIQPPAIDVNGTKGNPIYFGNTLLAQDPCFNNQTIIDFIQSNNLNVLVHSHCHACCCDSDSSEISMVIDFPVDNLCILIGGLSGDKHVEFTAYNQGQLLNMLGWPAMVGYLANNGSTQTITYKEDLSSIDIGCFNEETVNQAYVILQPNERVDKLVFRFTSFVNAAFVYYSLIECKNPINDSTTTTGSAISTGQTVTNVISTAPSITTFSPSTSPSVTGSITGTTAQTTRPSTTRPATTGPATTGPATVAPATTAPATTLTTSQSITGFLTGGTTAPATTRPATVAPATTAPATTLTTSQSITGFLTGGTTAPATTRPATTAPATVAPATTAPATTRPATVAPATTSTTHSITGFITAGTVTTTASTTGGCASCTQSPTITAQSTYGQTVTTGCGACGSITQQSTAQTYSITGCQGCQTASPSTTTTSQSVTAFISAGGTTR